MTDNEFWYFMKEALNNYICRRELPYHCCDQLIDKFDEVKDRLEHYIKLENME